MRGAPKKVREIIVLSPVKDSSTTAGRCSELRFWACSRQGSYRSGDLSHQRNQENKTR